MLRYGFAESPAPAASSPENQQDQVSEGLLPFGPSSPVHLRLQDVHDGQMCPGSTWRQVKSFVPDMSRAKEFLRTVPYKYTYLRGKGPDYKVYRCSSHQNCEHMIRIRSMADKVGYLLEESAHSHAVAPAEAGNRGVPHPLKQIVAKLLKAGKPAKVR